MCLKSKKNKIFYLYDDKKKNGNGHYQRCKYLSNIFSKKYKHFFLEFKNYKKILSKKKQYLFGFVDSYKCTFEIEKKLKDKCKKLITIDDFSERKFASDIIINYSNFAKKNFYKEKISNSKLLLGTNYNFISTKKKNSFLLKKKLNIFIYFGKKKRLGLIKKILKSIINFKNINLIFIAGNGKKFLNHNMFLKKLDKSHIVLTSSGVTLQEAINRNKMIFSKYFSNNQKIFFMYHYKRKTINNLDDFGKIINLPLETIKNILKKRNKILENYNYKNIKSNKIKKFISALS